MAKKSTSRPGKTRVSAKRTNTGRDSENAAKGPIIRSLPQSMSGEPGHDVPRKSLVKRALVVLLILLVAAFTYLTCKARGAVLTETGTIKIEGLNSGVTISRDALGVPLVKADNEDDAFFGAGYAAATDRLWQMYAAKLAVTGRLAELAGSKMLPVDVYMRTVGIRRNVDRAIDKLTDKYLRRSSPMQRA